MDDHPGISSADARLMVAVLVTAIVTALVVYVVDRLMWGPPSPPPPPGPPTLYRPPAKGPTRPPHYIPMSYTYGGSRIFSLTQPFYVDLDDAASLFEELRRYGMAGVAIVPVEYDAWITGLGRLYLVEHDSAQELLDVYDECNKVPRNGFHRRLGFIAVYPKGVKGAIFTTESPMLRAIVERHPTWGDESEESEQQPLDLDRIIALVIEKHSNPMLQGQYTSDRHYINYLLEYLRNYYV
ncbi:hypothetical protein ABW21_db0203350 [Orbilia brochopaga]|nr:hypothetical protein ABW21_db0203350 [Drechslerella brochopaga]